MLRYGIAAAAMLAASPAAAQTTSCRWVFNVWTCDTQERPRIDWGRADQQIDSGQILDAFEAGRRARIERDRARAETAAAIAALEAEKRRAEMERRQVEVRYRVRDLAWAKRCDEAQALAIGEGMFDLAEAVRMFCAERQNGTGAEESAR